MNDQSLRMRVGERRVEVDLGVRAGCVAAGCDEVAVVRLDRERAHERELGRQLVLGERFGAVCGGGRQRVEGAERVLADLGRHARQHRVDVDGGAYPARTGNDQLAERLDGLGASRIERRHSLLSVSASTSTRCPRRR